MNITKSRFVQTVQLIFRTVLYMCMLVLLFLLGRSMLELLNSFSVPFGFSSSTVLVLGAVFVSLFFCLGLLVVIHFFTSRNMD